jgi:putative transposase
MVKAVKLDMKVKDVAIVFDVSRKTVWKWCKRVSKKGWPNYRDRSKRHHTTYSKVNPYVENAIIILRDSFQWGTQRIKVYLEHPPDYLKISFGKCTWHRMVTC